VHIGRNVSQLGPLAARICANPGKLAESRGDQGTVTGVNAGVPGVYAKITAGQTGLLPRALPARCKVIIVALPGFDMQGDAVSQKAAPGSVPTVWDQAARNR
jgi:hypothetical protein